MVMMVKENAEDLKARTLRALRSPPKLKARAVFLHDFFIHSIVRYEYSFDEFLESLRDAYERGSGELQGFRQEVEGGGQASGIAFSLASLGVDCKLLTRAGEMGEKMSDLLLPGVEVKSFQGTPGLATTLGFPPDINIGMCYPGSNENFPPSLIIKEDFSEVDLICINNYWLNRSGGELLQHVLEKTKSRIYLTTGNPAGHERDFLILFNILRNSKGRVRTSLSEAEALYYMRAFEIDHTGDRLSVDEVSDLSGMLGCSVDLHTPDYTISSKYIVPTFRLKTIYRSIGAGNLWDGGNIYGILARLKADERLVLANGLAGLRISQVSTWLKRATLDDVRAFVEENTLKAI